MVYFIIFNKKGIVEYEEGQTPQFLNPLIRSINTQQVSGSKNLRDLLMEYRIEGQTIYLSLNNKPILNDLISKYKKEENKDNQIENSKKSEGKSKNLDENLDFSNRDSKVSNVIDSIKKTDFKRTFNLFTNKIGIEQLKYKMIEHLVKKNVDPSFCQIITDDIISELKSENIDMVSESVFKDKVSKSLNKVIPKFDHNKLIESIRNNNGVFSICFVGVNGVGKSTTLAKLACWLIQKGLKVYIAACDTFRAGAIEQLKVHVERFKLSGHDVGFFESGYSKDDASVAKHAIQKANKEGYDVILIDTAGRMHNKENLMVSLTKLIKMNSPNHIVFVGEALVGGDSLDHIKEFNKRIAEGNSGRKIDSVILTKIDTVDDKIGQVLNFTFTSSAPIMFLGTGQSNSDLQEMDSKVITDVLLS